MRRRSRLPLASKPAVSRRRGRSCRSTRRRLSKDLWGGLPPAKLDGRRDLSCCSPGAGAGGVERGISYQRAARALLIEDHARHLPLWRAHPLWRRLGQVVVKVYRYYRAAFRCSSASISGAGKQLQSTQSVRFFGGISSGIMLGLLATWRCLLLDIVQTGVTSWLAPVRARCGSPTSHYLFLGQDRS